MYASINSGTLSGIDAACVRVEIDLAPGLPGIYLVGLPDAALREARERVKSAIRNSDLPWPQRRTVVNLAPADLRKEGPALDLPMALAVLLAQSVLPPDCTSDTLVVGELSLNGELRPVRGALNFALLARDMGLRRVLLPAENYHEAALVQGIEHVPLDSLAQSVAYLRGAEAPPPPTRVASQSVHAVPDLADVKGQYAAARALEIAATGRHNLLLTGPPGTGKSMLAARLPGLLPTLDNEQALNVTRISSAAGHRPDGLARTPPFRAPHHSITPAALLGGRQPGEISLAHHGVLFLDEVGEFPQHVLDLLRQPLESGVIAVTRHRVDQLLPASIQLVAARNPCPCGYRDVPGRDCRCNASQIQAYRRRLSGPLLDRIDLKVPLRLLPARDLPHLRAGTATSVVRERVLKAHGVALTRQGKVNAALTGLELRHHTRMEAAAERFMDMMLPGLAISARAYDRLLRVARTIADLADSRLVGADHLSEAMSYMDVEVGVQST